tara:strand:+ start:83025 stop:83471 length:447 start_codon:yes stop_codon:yes gene_type:complete
MKALTIIFLFSFAFSVFAQAQSYYCVLKTKAAGQILAPTLVSRGSSVSNGALSQYLIQTHSPGTLIGLEAQRLDFRKPYLLDFKANLRGQVQVFRIGFTKSLGLVVTAVPDSDRFETRYEFIEAKSNPSTISISHRNGWSTEIACLPN